MGAHMGSFEVMHSLGRRQRGLRVAMAMYEENARKINATLAAINPRLATDIISLGRIDAMLKLPNVSTAAPSSACWAIAPRATSPCRR